MPRGYGSIQQFRRQQFTDSLAASSKFGTLPRIYTNKEPIQPCVGAKYGQQVNICSFAVRCDRMWLSTR